MAFKDTSTEFKLVDIADIDPDPTQPRKYCDEQGLKSLANAIKSKGLIHPLIVQPADGRGRYRLIVGERRWRAAELAGETQVPVLIRACTVEECLEIQVFENLGLGLRVPLAAREMAQAIQTIARRFENEETAAEHFGRSANWLNQATAAANLSAPVTAMLEAGKIAGTTTAVQLERLARNDAAKASALIEQVPEGAKLSKVTVDNALTEAGLKRVKKKAPLDEVLPLATPMATAAAETPVIQPVIQPASPSRKPSAGKIRQVAEILGLTEGDDDFILAQLVDEFLAMKGDAGQPF